MLRLYTHYNNIENIEVNSHWIQGKERLDPILEQSESLVEGTVAEALMGTLESFGDFSADSIMEDSDSVSRDSVEVSHSFVEGSGSFALASKSSEKALYWLHGVGLLMLIAIGWLLHKVKQTVRDKIIFLNSRQSLLT